MADDTGRTIAELETLTQTWVAAELGGDIAVLDRMLADDFVGIGPRGFLVTKEHWLARFGAGGLRYDSFVLDEVRVRVYSEAAIVTGRQTQTGSFQTQDVQAQLRAMLVYVRQHGVWRLAGLQLSPLMPPVNEAQR
jgi:ketosteroid isomerase-like protein